MKPRRLADFPPDAFLRDERKERIRDVLSKRQKTMRLVIDNVWDPHNVGAILRSCDAFGIWAVHLYYTTQAFPDLGKKASASARKWVQRYRHTDANEMVGRFHEQDYQVVITGFEEGSVNLQEVDFTRPTAVVLSNEHAGVSPELASRADAMLHIPMVGMVQSLNVSVAAAVILYESQRQRMAAGMYDAPTFSEDELENLYRDWCAR